MTVSVATPTWVAPSPIRPSTERSTPRVPAAREVAATSGGSAEMVPEELVGPVNQMDLHRGTVSGYRCGESPRPERRCPTPS